MHEVALSAGPVAVILIGILFGIFYNQRGLDKMDGRIDRVEGRLDKLESRMESNFALIRHTLEIIQNDLKDFHRILGQHEEAIVIIKKRLEL
jgi:hypothetical protein